MENNLKKKKSISTALAIAGVLIISVSRNSQSKDLLGAIGATLCVIGLIVFVITKMKENRESKK